VSSASSHIPDRSISPWPSWPTPASSIPPAMVYGDVSPPNETALTAIMPRPLPPPPPSPPTIARDRRMPPTLQTCAIRRIRILITEPFASRRKLLAPRPRQMRQRLPTIDGHPSPEEGIEGSFPPVWLFQPEATAVIPRTIRCHQHRQILPLRRGRRLPERGAIHSAATSSRRIFVRRIPSPTGKVLGRQVPLPMIVIRKRHSPRRRLRRSALRHREAVHGDSCPIRHALAFGTQSGTDRLT
jgi:hypothetical protein